MIIQPFIVISCILIHGGIAIVDQVITPTIVLKDVNPPDSSDRVTVVTESVSRVDALVGENVMFDCMVRDLMLESDSIRWFKINGSNSLLLNEGLKSTDSSVYRITQGSAPSSVMLELMSVSYNSESTYSCEVYYNSRSPPVRKWRQLKVYEMPRFSVKDTSFESSASVGDSVTLTCGAKGKPQPQLYWHRSAGSSSVIRNYGRQVEGSSITFESVQSSDRGTYVCNAINTIGLSQWPVKLNINFQPSVKFENSNPASQKIGCTLELLCVIEANPVPAESAVVVSKDGNTLVHGTDGVSLVYMKGADSTVYMSIFIFPFKESHTGSYTCTASNSVQQGTGSASIRVTTSSTAIAGRSGTSVCSACGLVASVQLAILAACLSVVAGWARL